MVAAGGGRGGIEEGLALLCGGGAMTRLWWFSSYCAAGAATFKIGIYRSAGNALSLQLCVFCFGLFQDGEIGIGVLAER